MPLSLISGKPLSSLTQRKKEKENVDVSTYKKLIPYSSSARRKEYSSSARRKEKEDVCTYNFCKEEPESGAHSVVLELLIRADVYVFLTTTALWVKELNGIPLYSRIWIHRIKPTESDLEIEFFIWPPPP
ncbi:hypothetical protein FCV25MIE_20584 [Fagus crenata]